MHKGERIGFFFQHHHGNRVGWKGETKQGGKGERLASKVSGPSGQDGRQSSELEVEMGRNRQIEETEKEESRELGEEV